MLGHERLLQIDNLVEANVGVEPSLDSVEENDGSVSTTTTVKVLDKYLSRLTNG